MVITLLCKVLDNYGDIGTVYRLARRLVEISSLQNKINIIVDDLFSFKRICPLIEISKNFQVINNINVYDWNDYDFCYSCFNKENVLNLGVVLECFQCGRPSWMEKIFFEEPINHTIQTIMIDYLSAESYVEDFHLLASLTRSSKIQKINFMPGFTKKSGGLIIDQKWQTLPKRDSDGPILIFTYKKNWSSFVLALQDYVKNNSKQILVANGVGQESFASYAKNKIATETLPYLDLDQWDSLMQKCSLLFVRGEESLSRAVLSGIPFVWHAYVQSDDYQIVKVKALLNLMKEHFTKDDFTIIENVWLDFNQNEELINFQNMQNHISLFLKAQDKLSYGFVSFAKAVRQNGDLALNLMTFIQKIDIIN